MLISSVLKEVWFGSAVSSLLHHPLLDLRSYLPPLLRLVTGMGNYTPAFLNLSLSLSAWIPPCLVVIPELQLHRSIFLHIKALECLRYIRQDLSCLHRINSVTDRDTHLMLDAKDGTNGRRQHYYSKLISP